MPKTLVICGVTYTIKYEPTMSGGETHLNDKVIVIGSKNKGNVVNILLHEIGEALAHERGLRYSRYEEGNDGVRFIMTHHEYENLIADIVTIIPQIKGLKGK